MKKHLNYLLIAIFSFLIVAQFIDGRPAIYRKNGVHIFDKPIDVSEHILTDMNGKQYKLSELTGELTILAFWAPWCMYCAEEFPQMNAISKQLTAKGITIIPIVKSDESRKEIENFYRKYELLDIPPFISDEKLLYAKLGVRSFPNFILVNKQGQAFSNSRPKWESDDLMELFDKLGSSQVPAAGGQ
jgi:thiol-disulfide isomerase/thioredoxin